MQCLFLALYSDSSNRDYITNMSFQQIPTKQLEKGQTMGMAESDGA